MQQIGEVAESVGLSLRTIRHYEDVGLVVPSQRSPGGFRLYAEAEVQRLRVVKQLKPLDFTLEEVRDLLDALDKVGRRGPARERTEAIQRLSLYATLAQDRCDRLGEQLRSAEALAGDLRRAVLAAHGEPVRRP